MIDPSRIGDYMRKHLLLAGGGHAHMVSLANLHRFTERGHRVTVIGPSAYHYYSGMGPGMLGKTYAPEEIRFATQQVVEKQGGRFLLGQIAGVDPERQTVALESGETVSYDVISFNVGSKVPRDMIGSDSGDIFTVKPIERLLEAQKRILELASRKEPAVAIIGGGPSAVEVAGNIWRLARHHGQNGAKIRIFTNTRLMPNHPDNVRGKAKTSLSARGIEIREMSPVHEIESGKVELSSGETWNADIIFVALGVKPTPIFKDSGFPTGPDGGLLVNRFLQSTAYENVFGGGDCIYFKDRPLDKVGVYAVRQNPVLFENLMAFLEGGELAPFDPGGDYLLIFNLGDGTGIFRKRSLLFGGRPAFLIKDYIDRKFMRKFQAIE
jgi:NADH dehydrogenase FAD-containing subunit